MMSNELLPCPFCGCKAIYVTHTHYYDDEDTVCVFCNGCKSLVILEQNEAEGINDKTKAEAVAAWNTRADTEYGAITATEENMARYGWVREQTCKEYGSVRVWQSCNVWSHELSCGHEVDTLEQEPPNYCPNCGARVVSE